MGPRVTGRPSAMCRGFSRRTAFGQSRCFVGVNMAVQEFKPRVALLTGVTGQDGAYLAEYLLGLGYAVHGVKRPPSSFNTPRTRHTHENPYATTEPVPLPYGAL